MTTASPAISQGIVAIQVGLLAITVLLSFARSGRRLALTCAWLSSIGGVGTLLLFAAMAFVIGLVVRPLLVNLNRLFAREIKESDMIIGEEVELPERG